MRDTCFFYEQLADLDNLKMISADNNDIILALATSQDELYAYPRGISNDNFSEKDIIDFLQDQKDGKLQPVIMFE
jgi:hypothetical protein